MSEQLSIFNVGQHQEELNQSMLPQKGESKLFDPRIKKADDVLVFVLRPMPYVDDVKKSLVKKHYYALPDQQGTIWYDSMSTFNDKASKKYEFCPVSDLWVRLQQSSDPAIKQRAGQLRMQIANYAYMQIVNFPSDPTLNGKILPMRLPSEMIKLFQTMANPSEQDIALGAKPIQPFDIMSGYGIKCTVRGKIVDGQLMRDWTCEKYDAQPCQAKFPLGPNNAMTDVSLLPQDAVIAHFKEYQTENLEQVYGYHEPNIDTKVRMYNYMLALVSDVPGLVQVVEGYFPEIKAHLANSAQAQPAAQALPVTAPNPMQAAVQQPAAQPETQQPPLTPSQPAAQPPLTPSQPAAQPPLTPSQPAAQPPLTPSQPANGIVLP